MIRPTLASGMFLCVGQSTGAWVTFFLSDTEKGNHVIYGKDVQSWAGRKDVQSWAGSVLNTRAMDNKKISSEI